MEVNGCRQLFALQNIIFSVQQKKNPSMSVFLLLNTKYDVLKKNTMEVNGCRQLFALQNIIFSVQQKKNPSMSVFLLLNTKYDVLKKKYYGSEWVPSTVRSSKHHLQCSAEEKSFNECLSSAE